MSRRAALVIVGLLIAIYGFGVAKTAWQALF